MRLKLIACKSMFRELSYLSAITENTLDVTYIRQGYHESPDFLRKKLQEEIDLIETGKDAHTNQFTPPDQPDSPQSLPDFDAILLGYGLCSNGIVGLHSKNHTLVVPRGHDCMTLLLGSKERYMEYFKSLPGCFWYSTSWIENSAMPCQFYHQKQEAYFRDMDYDEDTIDFCMEQMTGWTKNYHWAAYLKMPFFDRDKYRDFTKQAAEFYHWQFKEVEGDMSLLQRFLEGKWNEEDFLIVPPGYRIITTGDERIIACEKIE